MTDVSDASIVVGDLPDPDLPKIDLPQIAEPVYEQEAGEPLRMTLTEGVVEETELEPVEETELEPVEPISLPPDEYEDQDWVRSYHGKRMDNRRVLTSPDAQDFENQGIDPRNLLDDDAFDGAVKFYDRVMEPYAEVGRTILDVNQETGRALWSGIHSAAQGFLDITHEMSELLYDIPGTTPNILRQFGVDPVVIWDDQGLRLTDERPDNYEAYTLPKFFTDPQTMVGQIGADLTHFVAAMGAFSLGTLGTIPYGTARFMALGGIADALFDPEEGNFSTMLMELGVEPDAVLLYLGTPVGEDADAAERLGQRIKNAFEGAAIGLPFDLAVPFFKAFQALKGNPDNRQRAIDHLSRKLGLPTEAAPTSADLDVAMPAPAPTGPRQLPLVPDEPRQTAADLPGTPVAEMPPKPLFAHDLDELGFYSAALRAARELKQEKGTPTQMRAALLKVAGVKEEELVWTGLDDLFDRRILEGKKARITKQEIIEHLRENRVEIEEIEGVKVERGGREEIEAQEGTVPTAWSQEVVEDLDYISSRADDMRSELDFYWDQVADKVSPRLLRGHVLEELGITPGSDRALYIKTPADMGGRELSNPYGALDVPLSEIDFLRAVRDLKDLGVLSDEVVDNATWQNVLQRIADDGDADDALYDIAKAEYDENPYYQYFDDSGHGYVITGSDEIGWTLETPGMGGNRYFERLDDAQQGAVDDAYEQGLVDYDYEGGEFEPEYMGYTMAGSKSQNYRELLFKFPNPTDDPYRYGHFSDDFAEGFTSRDLGEATESDLISPENVGAHVRVSDLNIRGKGKGFLLDEAQSDLHKKQRLPGGGYGPPIYRRSTAKEEAKLKEANESIEEMFHSASELSDRQRVEASPLFHALIADLKATPDDTLIVSNRMVPTSEQRSGEEIYTDIADLLGIRDLLPDVLDGNMPGPTTMRGMLTESSDFYGHLADEYGQQFLPPSVTNSLETFMPLSVPAQEALDGGQGISDATKEMIRNYNNFAMELDSIRRGGTLESPVGINAHQAISDALLKRENIPDPLLAKFNSTKLMEVPTLNPDTQALLDEYRSAVSARDNLQKEIREIQGSGRPDMPFKSMDERGWPRVVILRLLRYAIENDYDYFAWTPGAVQKARYNAPRDLYDKTIPKVVNKFLKKFDPSLKIDDGVASGIQVGDIPLPNIKITAKMRDSIKRLGQAIFTLTGGVGLAEMTQDQEQTQTQ